MKIPKRQMEAWAEHMSRAHHPVDKGEFSPPPNPKIRLPRQNNEARDMERLVVMAAREWWWPGFRHHMQERQSRKEAWDGFSRGVKAGWPDVTLLIPDIAVDYPHPSDYRFPVRAALELKAEERRPKQKGEQWWLYWWPEEMSSSHYGLTGHQARCLQDLHACGFQTMVAYGAQEAFDWLNEVAGPRPEVLPEGW